MAKVLEFQCEAAPDSWTPFLIPLVLIALRAPHHDNSSLIASLGCCNLVSMYLSDSGLPEQTLRFGALLHLVLGDAATGCWCRIKDSGLGGSNVSSLGVSTIRPGLPFLWAAPSSWDESQELTGCAP